MGKAEAAVQRNAAKVEDMELANGDDVAGNGVPLDPRRLVDSKNHDFSLGFEQRFFRQQRVPPELVAGIAPGALSYSVSALGVGREAVREVYSDLRRSSFQTCGVTKRFTGTRGESDVRAR